MGLPLWSILTGLRIGQGHWQQQLNTVRSFQELYSTINMGLFVGLNSETGASRERLMRDLDIGIKAHIFLCPSIFIYNLYWGEIFGTPWLRAYFNKFKSWRRFLEARLKDPSKWDFVDITDDLLESLKFFLKKYVTQKSNADIMLSPWLFTATIRYVFDGAITRGLDSTVTAAQGFLAEVTQDEGEADVSFIKEDVIRLLNPAIDVDWIVMKVAITQLYFYDVILRKNPGALTGRGKPEPYVKGQRYKLLEDGKELSWSPITDEGSITVKPDIEIKHAQIATDEEIEALKRTYGETAVRVYQLDSHGIKSSKIAAVWTGEKIHVCGPYYIHGYGTSTICKTTYDFDVLGVAGSSVAITLYARFRQFMDYTQQFRLSASGEVGPVLYVYDKDWHTLSSTLTLLKSNPYVYLICYSHAPWREYKVEIDYFYWLYYPD